MNRLWLSIASLTVGAVMMDAGGAMAQVPPPPPATPNANILQAALYGNGPVASPYAVPVYGLTSPAPEDAETGNRYGLHPVLKRLFHIKGDCCGKGDCEGGKFGKHKGAAAPAGKPVYNNPAQGGTLVFPNHPYARSPRDFFYDGSNR